MSKKRKKVPAKETIIEIDEEGNVVDTGKEPPKNVTRIRDPEGEY